MIDRLFKAGSAIAVLAGGLLFSGTASAVTPNFYDDFENNVGGDIVWTTWTGVPGSSNTPIGNNNLVTTDNDINKNVTAGGTRTARVFASNPANWTGYADFGATAGAVHAECWVFEDRSNPGATDGSGVPVTAMLSLYGDSGDATPNPGDFTDFIQLGVVPFYAGSATAEWGSRTLQGGIADGNVVREAGFTKLRIEADALADGGQIRFYVDTPSLPEQLIRTSGTAGVNLRWVRIGNNSASNENFWYDDVRVVPEPAAAALIGLGALGALASRRRRT